MILCYFIKHIKLYNVNKQVSPIKIFQILQSNLK